ncbi:MAG: hypothetical protein IJU18_03370 [Oscillospiraceae bacterium]|nr:hypothetical protein [Oscillospiraceae bacterium]
MTKFCISLAEQTIEIEARYDFARRFCRDYLTDEAPTLRAAASETDVAEDMAAVPGTAPEYAETLGIYRSIAEQLPERGAFLMHGAAIAYGGKAYLFTAPSGTGKSTHIALWHRYLGAPVQIVNGDKPLIRVREEGVDVCSTPWAGKERWQRNCIVPLGGVCLLHRGTENAIRRADPAELLTELMHQVYIPRSAAALAQTLELLDEMLRLAPLYLLACDMSEQAVVTSFEAMTGRPYPAGEAKA